MTKQHGSTAKQLADRLREDLRKVLEDVRQLELDPRTRSIIGEELQRSAATLNGLIAQLDPIQRPGTVFDPGNPRTVGYFVALAMTAQDKKSLQDLSNFYGAGIYALYYHGEFPSYKLISSTETPIYVGMAVQGASQATKPEAQGQPLAKRLAEHRKNIQRAATTLRVEDFYYRALVVQSGWEDPAEDYLIRLFRPLWNRETAILYGFGKHGDSSQTRRNRRSPWDTLHAGRKWAQGGDQLDAMTLEQIVEKVETHLAGTPVFKSFQDVLFAFLANLKQQPSS
jgi:hypothetical protein